MWLLHSSSVFFREKHVLVRSSLLQGWYPVDAVHYLWCNFLRDMNDPPVDGPIAIISISLIALCG